MVTFPDIYRFDTMLRVGSNDFDWQDSSILSKLTRPEEYLR